MYLSAIYIFSGSVCLFGCSKMGKPILGIYKSVTDTWMWKLGDRTLFFCFGNNMVMQFHFWEYINRNQKVILDSRRPLICSSNHWSENFKMLLFNRSLKYFSSIMMFNLFEVKTHLHLDSAEWINTFPNEQWFYRFAFFWRHACDLHISLFRKLQKM
jgi:hypothetical protein